MTDLTPEVIDINKLQDISVINIGNISGADGSVSKVTGPVNFGSGIELLMNDKKKENSGSKSDIDLGDLNRLENELNELSEEANIKVLENSKSGIFSSILNNPFRGESNADEQASVVSDGNHERLHVNFDENLGKASNSSEKEDKTWDGYNKFNNIPINPDQNATSKMSREEMLKEKFKYLRKLEALEKKGVNLTKRYDMESSLDEMQGEYEMIMAEKEKSNSIKFQGRMLMAALTGIEFLNNKFDPFDIKLEGWSEQINENIDDYDEIFAELHDKYKSKATMAPEIKLLFQLGGSALMIHMTNTMFKSAMPGMDDIMKQNPELMKQFTQAAANTMGETNPGFGGFMNNFIPGMGGGGESERVPPNVNMGPPPPPVETQTTRSQRQQPPVNRPDINDARNNGISILDQFESTTEKSHKSIARRPEMKGPNDISDILAGLKTKQINIQDKKDDSTISIKELKELNANSISRPKRKQKSDKNTISLDI